MNYEAIDSGVAITKKKKGESRKIEHNEVNNMLLIRYANIFIHIFIYMIVYVFYALQENSNSKLKAVLTIFIDHQFMKKKKKKNKKGNIRRKCKIKKKTS